MRTLLIILSVLILFSCEKEDNEEANTAVSGRIVQDCNGTPLANKSIEAWVKLSGTCWSLTGCTDLLYTTTDANGNFSFNTKKGSMEIRLKGSNTILDGIPVLGNLDLGTFNAFPTTSFVYRIKVNNPYSVGDTLYLSVPPFTPLRGYVLSAPFQDSIFTLVENYQELGNHNYGGTSNVEVKFGVTVSKDGFIRDSVYYSETKIFNLPSCPSRIDTLTIEIN